MSHTLVTDTSLPKCQMLMHLQKYKGRPRICVESQANNTFDPRFIEVNADGERVYELNLQ